MVYTFVCLTQHKCFQNMYNVNIKWSGLCLLISILLFLRMIVTMCEQLVFLKYGHIIRFICFLEIWTYHKIYFFSSNTKQFKLKCHFFFKINNNSVVNCFFDISTTHFGKRNNIPNTMIFMKLVDKQIEF